MIRRLLLIVLTTCFCLTAIGPQTARSQTTASSGVLRIAIESLSSEVLDPILGPQSATKLYLPLMYDTLVGADKTNSDISKDTGVARDWKISPDGKTYTFYLRRGIKFSNGDDLTADDVKFTLERSIGPRSVSSNSGALKKVMDSITVVDPYTVTIQLKVASFSFIYYMSSLIGSEAMIVPKKYIERVGDEKFATQPIGSGPYKLKAYVPGNEISFAAIPRHWSIGVPKFAEVDMLNVPEQGTRLTMLRSNQADVISIGREYIGEMQKDGFLVNTKRAANEMLLLINNQWQKGPLADKRVRNAMELAIDRKAILEKLAVGAGELNRCWLLDVSYQSRPPGLCDEPPYDPAAAKKLLADAGYANGFDMTYDSYPTLGVPEKSEIDQAIATYLRAVGIRANIRQIEYGAYRTAMAKPDGLPNTIAANPTVSQIVIASYIQQIFGADGLLTVTKGSNPQADKSIAAMVTAGTREDYTKNLFAAWSSILDNSNTVMLFSVDGKYAANPKTVGGLWPMGASTADLGLRYLVKR